MGLTMETFTALKQTTSAAIMLAQHLLMNVLLGQVQSDFIESRFSWYRQLSGANYYFSARQILDAEKKIRILSLTKFDGLNVQEIRNIHSSGSEIQDVDISKFKTIILASIEVNEMTYELERNDEAHLYVIFGYIARSQTSRLKCNDFFDFLVFSKDFPLFTFSESGLKDSKHQLLEQKNRGPYSPTEFCFNMINQSVRGVSNYNKKQKIKVSIFSMPKFRKTIFYSML
uniref:Putative LOC101234561 [Hydra vulgaris] n=1 Tax=Lepeophtheirus salmonis TaxID=72036 RepID=A0A0K2ULN5_LEPSM